MILAVWFLVTHIVLSTAEVPDICETSSAPHDFINSYPPIQDVCSLAASLSGNLSLSGSQSFLVSSRATNKYQPNNPTVLVTPLNTADIQKVVRFVDKFNIQLVVSSSGMDLFGRTSGNDTLHLDMSKMDDININRNDQSVESGISATMGPGVVTVNAYKHLDTFGLVMSGGWCPGVAMAGFVAGGGTGPLTRYYGYGADNVLSATLVTANGTILYVDHQEISATYLDGSTAQVKDPELFRALRGGVGGTYGIITEYKYTLYEAPQTLWVTFNVPMYNSAGDDYGKKCLVKYFEWLVSLEHVDEIGGLVSLSHQSNMPGRGLIRVFMFHYGDLDEGYRIVKPVTDYCKPYSFRNDIQYKNYTHWGGFGSTLDWKYNQDFTYPVSRFLQLDDLKANGEAKSVVMKIVEAFFETNIWMCTIEVTGGKGKRYTDHASTSISPGFRSSDAELICFSKNLEASTKKETHDFATQHVYPHGEGIHPNEADFDLEDWHVHAWGSQKNYDRLLDVKRRYDPGQLFKCSYCVGAKEHEREFYRMQLL